jgi:restriction system protein
MASPKWEEYMQPVLDVLADQDSLTRREIVAQVAKLMGLTEEQMRETIKSGEPRYMNRIGWALTDLARAGAIRRPRRGFYEITQRGRLIVAEGQPVTELRLMEFSEYARYARGSDAAEPALTGSAPHTANDEAPQETIDRIASELRRLLEEELVERLCSIDPLAFERLVLRVLRGMGYGKDGSLNTTKVSGDEGIDGIISEDPLGLDRIYMQAKRYQGGSKVGSPAVREFIGALATHRGDRGVFITSSGFTAEARDTAKHANARIELIDGRRLAKLMIDNEIGVQVKAITAVYSVDEDFFEGI